MIVDIHTHAWNFPNDFSDEFIASAQAARGDQKKVDLTIRYEDYARQTPDDEAVATVVFGGKARLSGLWVDDQYVADYVAAQPDRLLGFMSIDPTQAGWEDEMRRGREELGLVGIKLLPMYAGFLPQDERLDPLWQYATEHRLPVLLHTGTTFIRQAPIECTLPRHLDPVAIRYPDVKIVMAHLAHPYEGECIAVIRKHPNVYADISALHYRPFQFFHALMLVQEYGVWHKLLFGTDYPFTTVNSTIEALRTLNEELGSGRLARLDEGAIDTLIHRDALSLLGLPHPASVQK